MLNPVVIPLPLAAAAVAALLAVALYAHRWLERDAATPNPWTGQAWAKLAPAGRHRLDAVTEPYRPRDAITLSAERAADNERFVRRLEETRARAGNGMWSWSDENWAGDTRELAAVR